MPPHGPDQAVARPLTPWRLDSYAVAVVRGLNGAIGTTKADQRLLVAWVGLNKGGHDELRANQIEIRLWDSEDVLDQLFAVYERLPAETRARLPLKQAWVLDEETG